MSLLIGITTRDHKGASLMATHLRQQHGFEIVTIATPFEAALAGLLDTTPERIHAQSSSHQPLLPNIPKGHDMWTHHTTIGTAIRTLRCEFAHDLHEDFVPLQLETRLQRISESQDAQLGIVIPDIIFNNEADFIRSHSGIVIHLKNDLTDRSPASHYSGFGISRKDEDMTLHNNGTASDLLMALDNLMARVNGFTGYPMYLSATK